MDTEDVYFDKYQKYKAKYLELKKNTDQAGGAGAAFLNWLSWVFSDSDDVVTNKKLFGKKDEDIEYFQTVFTKLLNDYQTWYKTNLGKEGVIKTLMESNLNDVQKQNIINKLVKLFKSNKKMFFTESSTNIDRIFEDVFKGGEEKINQFYMNQATDSEVESPQVESEIPSLETAELVIINKIKENVFENIDPKFNEDKNNNFREFLELKEEDGSFRYPVKTYDDILYAVAIYLSMIAFKEKVKELGLGDENGNIREDLKSSDPNIYPVELRRLDEDKAGLDMVTLEELVVAINKLNSQENLIKDCAEKNLGSSFNECNKEELLKKEKSNEEYVVKKNEIETLHRQISLPLDADRIKLVEALNILQKYVEVPETDQLQTWINTLYYEELIKVREEIAKDFDLPVERYESLSLLNDALRKKLDSDGYIQPELPEIIDSDSEGLPENLDSDQELIVNTPVEE